MKVTLTLVLVFIILLSINENLHSMIGRLRGGYRTFLSDFVTGFLMFWPVGFLITGIAFGFSAYAGVAVFLSATLVFLFHEYLEATRYDFVEHYTFLTCPTLSFLPLLFIQDPTTLSLAVSKGVEIISTLWTHS